MESSDGYSALFVCCINGHLEIVKLLYKYGARVELLYLPNGAVSAWLTFHRELSI
jgi:ankyrin repeat protein